MGQAVGVRFSVDQPIAAGADEVQAALVDSKFYASLPATANISAPEIVLFDSATNSTHIELRYRFVGVLVPAARAVLDPSKLTWVQSARAECDERRTVIGVNPEHYGRRLSFSGWYQLQDTGPGRCVQHLEAEIKVRWPLVGLAVERAIVSGLREHLAEEAGTLARWVGTST